MTDNEIRQRIVVNQLTTIQKVTDLNLNDEAKLDLILRMVDDLKSFYVDGILSDE